MKLKQTEKNYKAGMISNLHKGDISNYRVFCLGNKNLSSRVMQMCAHIKSCLMKFFNKIKFIKRANLFDGKLCLTKKNEIFNLFCHYLSTSKISICEKI